MKANKIITIEGINLSLSLSELHSLVRMAELGKDLLIEEGRKESFKIADYNNDIELVDNLSEILEDIKKSIQGISEINLDKEPNEIQPRGKNNTGRNM